MLGDDYVYPDAHLPQHVRSSVDVSIQPLEFNGPLPRAASLKRSLSYIRDTFLRGTSGRYGHETVPAMKHVLRHLRLHRNHRDYTTKLSGINTYIVRVQTLRR